jgi:hypothetical protein
MREPQALARMEAVRQSKPPAFHFIVCQVHNKADSCLSVHTVLCNLASASEDVVCLLGV